MKLSVISPVYNEEETLTTLCEKISTVCRENHYDFEILFVDDGSNDSSPAILEELAEDDPHVRVILFQRNFGQSAALSAGFRYAQGDVIVTIDADLQNDPEDIPALVDKLNEGFDIVSGWRRGRRDSTLFRIIPSMAANRIIRLITGVNLHDTGCTLKAYRRQMIEKITLYGDLHRFIPILGHRIGARITEIEVRHHPRTHGVSKYVLGRVARVVFDLLTIKFLLSYSMRPMHFFGYISLWINFMACISGSIAVYLKWFAEKKQDLSDSPLLYLTILLIIVGVQFLATGLLAEINLRTYHESGDRATYLISKTLNLPE